MDSLVIIPNDRLKHATEQKVTFANAFEIADDVLRQAVLSISELIGETGFINFSSGFSSSPEMPRMSLIILF